VGTLRPAPPLGESTDAILAELAGREDAAEETGTERRHVLQS
jgi:hypothetical protein